MRTPTKLSAKYVLQIYLMFSLIIEFTERVIGKVFIVLTHYLTQNLISIEKIF